MEYSPSVRHYLWSALFLMLVGWGGLGLMIFVAKLPPLVWARWGFFALWLIALSGTALPVVYYLNLRFPSDLPAEPNTIVRQAIWVGVYGSIIAWLQLGRVMAFWMWMGLAGGLIGVEYLIRLRERSKWHPPVDSRGLDPTLDDYIVADGSPHMEGDEPPQ